ncbi:MAG: PAS domain S-box protein [Planctomycetota bacterium]
MHHTTNQADLLAGVLDSSLDGIMAFSSIRDGRNTVTDFRIEFVNRMCEDIVRRTAAQMLGQSMLTVFPGNKEDGLFDAYTRVVETGEPFFTEHHYAHDGLNHWFSIKAAKCGDGFTVTFSDITERKTSESEISKLSLIASRTDNGVVLTDAAGRVEWVNRAFIELTGYTLEEMQGQTPGILLQGPGTDPAATKRIRDQIKAGKGFSETLLNYRKSGEPYWIEIEVQPIRNDRGQITNYMAIERDVTEQREQRQELEAHRHRLEFALQASNIGLWDWDIPSGDNYLSDTWYTMLGYAPSELPMRIESWHEVTKPEDLHRAEAALQDYFTGKTPRYACEIRVRNKAGDYQWVLDTGEAIERDEAGNVTRMIGLHIDIHKLKTIQQALTEARDLAQKASAAKSAFVANMSHEIRTPMNAILGFSDLLLDVGQTEADKRNHAQTIRRNGKHLLRVLNDILDLSKIEAGKMSIESVTIEPAELFEDTINLLAPRAAKKGIALNLVTRQGLPTHFKSDPTRIRQVLINLVGNAVKFTQQGHVTLEVQCVPNEGGSATVRCDITDTGIGISPDQQQQLFKPFSQADESTTRKFGGSGLGLTISHNLCRMMGGDLACASTLGEGSTFTATFQVQPIRDADRKQATEHQPTHSNAADALVGKRVLIVEDGPDNQRLLKHYAAKAGAAVEVAENGELGRDAALAALKTGMPFDVILMDMQMPVLDGYNATAQLRDFGYDLPIIALTAHASADDRDKCLQAGCTDYMSKPVDRQKLIQVIADYMSPRHQDEAMI